jgi:hypothetical protein
MPQTYSCFIEDRRYRVPTLRFVLADDTSIREIAIRELLSDNSHNAIEVRAEGGEVILREERGR